MKTATKKNAVAPVAGIIIGRTNLGYAIFSDLTYRYTTISGITHVDEYVGGACAWVYLGKIPAKVGR